MDNEDYKAIYKCRLCGEEFEDCTTGEPLAMALTMALAINGTTKHVRYNGNLHNHIVHNCKNGSYGMADFQGFRKIAKDN